jgi:hypothetical protein
MLLGVPPTAPPPGLDGDDHPDRRGGDATGGVAQLDLFLRAYRDDVRTLTYHVLAWVDRRLAGAQRMVYENWNATVVAYSPDGRSRHAVCSVAAYPRWVNLYFFVGPELTDPHRLLRGSGSTVRHVRLTGPADLDERVADLFDEAVARSPWPFEAGPQTTTVVSVSGRRRPRR